jgi:hypothetical protein
MTLPEAVARQLVCSNSQDAAPAFGEARSRVPTEFGYSFFEIHQHRLSARAYVEFLVDVAEVCEDGFDEVATNVKAIR